MSYVGDLLSVIMDEIKDTEMMYQYSQDPENEDYKNWFYDKAKNRLRMLMEDYEQVSNAIGLTAKVRSGDPIAEALDSHINYQIMDLKKQIF